MKCVCWKWKSELLPCQQIVVLTLYNWVAIHSSASLGV